MPTPFQKLVLKYDQFEFRNITNIAQRFQLAKGDSVQINPFATVKIDSSLIISLPPASTIETLVPTAEDQMTLIPRNETVVSKPEESTSSNSTEPSSYISKKNKNKYKNNSN